MFHIPFLASIACLVYSRCIKFFNEAQHRIIKEKNSIDGEQSIKSQLSQKGNCCDFEWFNVLFIVLVVLLQVYILFYKIFFLMYKLILIYGNLRFISFIGIIFYNILFCLWKHGDGHKCFYLVFFNLCNSVDSYLKTQT